jgi:hypothetical protein
MSEKQNQWGSAAKGSPTGGPDISDLKKELTEEDTRQLNVEIPKSLHKRLKIHCLETEQDMKDVVSALLARHLSD